MEDGDDDFGELYGDVGLPATSAVNGGPQSTHLNINSSNQQQFCSEHSNIAGDDSTIDAKLGGDDDEKRENSPGTGHIRNAVVEERKDSESEEDDEDDDFVLVVNDEDFGGKAVGVEEKSGGEEVKEDIEVEIGVASPRNGVDHGGGGGGKCGGEVIGNVAKFNGGNSQYKYVRQSGSLSMGNQRITSSRRVDREHAGSAVLGFGDQGNGFWLPRYRTIFDVDIDKFDRKPWSHPGADVTDYFNFGLDEDKWRSYCQSLDQVRQQTSTQMRNQGYGNLRSNLAGATKLLESEEFAERESVARGDERIYSQESYLTSKDFNRQIGQAIHVEDSNTERQPSMDIKPPRNRDSDVVIEITLQEPEELSDSLKEPDEKQQRRSLSPQNKEDDKIEAQMEMSEEGCEQGEAAVESQISGDLKAHESRELSAEDNVHSATTSSDHRRSPESATVSSCMHEKSSIQKEEPNSESDTQSSVKVDSFPEGNEGTPKIWKDDAKCDRDSTDTNPCVAGIDLLSDDHIESSTTSSYSRSEGWNNDNHFHLRKTRNPLRSSPDSVMDTSQVARDNYHCPRVSERDDTKRKGSRKHSSRDRSSVEEGRVPSTRNYSRHSEIKSHQRNKYDYRMDFPNRKHADGHSRLQHQNEVWRDSSDFIDDNWPTYRGKDYSLDRYDRSSAEIQFHTECKRDLYLNHWESTEDRSLTTRRRCDEDHTYYERTRRMRDDMGRREWYREERGSIFREGTPPFQNQQHSIPKYHSSINMDWQSEYGKYHEERLNKRSKHDTPIEYRYTDCLMTDTYAHSPLHSRQREYLDSEIEHQGSLRHPRREGGISGRVDGFFDHPSPDLNYPHFIREDHEYQNRRSLPSIHDYQEEQPVYAERRHHFTLSRDDANVHLLCPRYERNSRYTSAKKSRDFRLHHDNKDAVDREDTGIYFHQDDHIKKRRHVFQSDGMDWKGDALLQSNNAFCDEIFDSGKRIPRHKRHEDSHGFVSGEMTIHTQGVKDRHSAIDAGGKFCDRNPKGQMGAKDERTGLWCRDPVESHNLRETKSSGNVSKSGGARISDAHLLSASCPEKAVNKAVEVEASHNMPSITTHSNASDLEEGQIPTAESSAEFAKANKFVSGGVAKKESLKESFGHSQDASRVCDESRILATMAKMEKRRERFKEPMLKKKDTDSDLKPQVVKIPETGKSTGQRPSRKRQWGGS